MTIFFNSNLFANMLKEKRERKGVTQMEAAKIFGCTQTTICFLEDEKQVPRIELFANICHWLNEPMESFIIKK